MSLKYQKGFVYEGNTFVVNKSDIHNAKDEQFVEGTALLPIDEPKPLTLYELIRMDGEPIWTVTIGLEGSGRWELCEGYTIRACPFKGAIRFVDLSGEATLYDYKTYGKTWLAYRTKPEGSGDE